MYVERQEKVSPQHVAALLTLLGRLDMSPGPGGSKITPLGKHLPAWQDIVGASIREPWGWAGVIALYPSKQIAAHTDPPVPNIRIHIPLQLNPNSWVFSDGTWQRLEEGHLYEMDPTKIHGAVNWGPLTRFHLMIDIT